MAVHRHFGKYLALVGAVVLSVGFMSPAQADPVTSCPAGSTLVAKFEFTSNGYLFAEPAGNEEVVTITAIDDVALASGAAWTSTMPISRIVVKGGSAEPPDGVSVKVITYEPPALLGEFSNEGLLNDGGNVPDISHVLFCGPEDAETTTTTVAGTSSTAGETSTTAVAGTTATTGTTATVQGTSVTQTTQATTEVLGVQLARTGFSSTMLVLGTSLLVLGLVVELLQRASVRRAS